MSTINSDGVKITEKTTVASVSGTDKVIINQGDTVKQATVDTVVNGSSLNTKVGLLESLTTGVKTSIVNAINWVITQLDTVNGKIGTTDISTIGDGTVTGAIGAVNNTINSIGTVRTGSNTVNCESGTWTLITQLALQAGTYDLTGKCMFPFAQVGAALPDRRIILEVETESPPSLSIENCVSVSAYNTALSVIPEIDRFVVPSNPTTFNLWAYQNSGQTMSIMGIIRSVKIR